MEWGEKTNAYIHTIALKSIKGSVSHGDHDSKRD